MNYIPLTQVCDFQGGSQPPKEQWIDHAEEGYIRMLQIRDFTQPDKDNIEYVRVTKTVKTCNKDDILIGRYGASVGKVLTGLSGAYNVAIIKTIPDASKLTKRFLYHYLKSPYFQSFILSVGSRAAQAGFNKEDLSDAHIPRLSLKEQEYVAGQLDKIFDLISLRKQQLSKLDELVKSRFIELFGDPDTNPFGWNEDVLSAHLDVIGGYAFKSDKFEDAGIPVLRIGNINSGRFLPVNMVYWNDDPALDRYKMYPGDLVMSLTGTVGKDDYGNVCILGADYPVYYLNQRNAKLSLKTTLNARYLSELLKFERIKRRLTGISRGVRQANISNKDILCLCVPIAPIELQEQFATFVEQTDKSKFEIQKSLEKLETLKKALMQKYFG